MDRYDPYFSDEYRRLLADWENQKRRDKERQAEMDKNSGKTEQKLLDAIEDAEEAVRRDRKFLNAALFTFIVGLVIIFASGVLGQLFIGGWAMAPIIVGTVTTISAAILLGVHLFGTVYDCKEDDYRTRLIRAKTPADKLKAAKRAHRDYIMDQV